MTHRPPRPHEGNGHKPPDFTRLYKALGVELGGRSGDEALGECPFCGKAPFHVNVLTGLYHCKHCEEAGNTTDYLTWLHKEALGQTTPEHYSSLGKKRGVAPQALRRHELAYVGNDENWIVPFKSGTGSVVNLMQYWPDDRKPNKLMLPGLPTALYGFDKLAAVGNKDKPVLLCEGPFDAIALDHDIGAEHRDRYVIVAQPGSFKEAWAEHFKGRKVFALYDNDKGGEQHRDRIHKLLGESGVAAELHLLRWPEGLPDGVKDVNDLVSLA
jgi:hypothetical protein